MISSQSVSDTSSLWVLDVDGPVDVPLFCSALTAAARRHDPLRTLAAPAVMDLARRAAPAGQGDPAVLYRLDADRHVLVLIEPHGSLDPPSARALLGDLAARYRSGAASWPSPSPAPPATPPAAATGAAEEIRDLDQTGQLELPWPRTAGGRHAQGWATAVICGRKGLAECLGAAAGDTGTSLDRFAEAAFAAWLYRHTGQRDLLIGIAPDGPLADVGRLPAVPARIRVDGGISVARLARDHAAATAGDLADDGALAELARQWQTRAGRPGAVVSVTTTPEPVELGRDIVVRPHGWPTRHAHPDLAVDLHLDGEHACITIAVRDGSLDANTARRLAERFEMLLSQVAADPSVPVSALKITTPAEFELVTTGWNPPPGEVVPQTVPERFGVVAARWPDRLALADDEGTELSYSQLRVAAGSLAQHLSGLGVGPDMCCAVIGRRSAATVVAMLGILEAGGAYVPIDPSLPAARIAAQLDDAGVVAVLTDSALAPRLPGGGWQVLLLDSLTDVPDDAEVPDPTPGLSPRSLAYVIYTSGSTGRPKGVLIEHQSLCHFVGMAEGFFGLTEQDRFIHVASQAFDVSVFEIFGALLTGASVHVAGDDTRGAPGMLNDFMRSRAISVLMATPSILELLDPDDLPALRVMSIGGEPFGDDLVRRWASGRRFVNGYGPAEATVEVVAKVCQPGAGPPPIGRALPRHRAFALDENMRPVPVGVAAELYVGGPGLARGYLARPALTAGSFVPDPFSSEPGARLYRTGDLVRWLPGGELLFLGRVDRQVKIRGMRVELGEVEETLLRHPDVAQVAVGIGAGEPKLVAYVVPARRPVGDVRSAAAEWLPAYMVPSEVVLVDEMPLTSVGKIDMTALAALAGQQARPAGTAPLTPTQEQVAAILRDILGVESVPLTEDVFSLGANSLQALRLLSRVRSGLGVMLTPRQLFDDPTVAGVASAVDARLADG